MHQMGFWIPAPFAARVATCLAAVSPYAWISGRRLRSIIISSPNSRQKNARTRSLTDSRPFPPSFGRRTGGNLLPKARRFPIRLRTLTTPLSHTAFIFSLYGTWAEGESLHTEKWAFSVFSACFRKNPCNISNFLIYCACKYVWEGLSCLSVVSLPPKS